MSEFFEDLSGMNLSKLNDCEVQDVNGEKVGRLIDAVLVQTEKGMEITKFVVGDSKIIELLEKLKLRKDIDPVFPISVIKKVSRSRIQLNVSKDDLKSTHIDSDALGDDEFRLEQLSRTPVFDASGDKIGRVIDLVFDNDKFQLILGDSPLSEWAEGVGLSEDIDFLISPKYINEFSKEKITLSKERSELKTTFVQNLDAFKRNRETTAEAIHQKNSIFFPRY